PARQFSACRICEVVSAEKATVAARALSPLLAKARPWAASVVAVSTAASAPTPARPAPLISGFAGSSGGRFITSALPGSVARGGAQGGGVVDAVAGHRHDLARRLQRAHDLVLVLGRDPGEHVDLTRQRRQRGAIEAGQLAGLGDPHVAVVCDAEVTRDRRRGLGLIAGDEDGPDAGGAAGGDGLPDAAP